MSEEGKLSQAIHAIGEKTPLQLGFVVLIIGVALYVGGLNARVSENEKRTDTLVAALAAEKATREEAQRRTDGDTSELKGSAIQTKTELRYIREGMDRIERLMTRGSR